ncbi:MAG TPA: hypothetical protein VMV41_07835 [Cellulomonadaceae bacterium]|nr:hypothetical protein [Cellulomonadaceae bacterium]
MRPGDFAVVATRSRIGWLIRLVTRSRYNHAFLYLGNGKIVEAESPGAVISPLADYDGYPVLWSNLKLTDAERAAIVAKARALVGTPYSWVDDACIALTAIFGVHVPGPVRRRLARPDRMMCSQLVDACYHAAGINLVPSKPLPGDVSPGDLADVIAGRPVPEHW